VLDPNATQTTLLSFLPRGAYMSFGTGHPVWRHPYGLIVMTRRSRHVDRRGVDHCPLQQGTGRDGTPPWAQVKTGCGGRVVRATPQRRPVQPFSSAQRLYSVASRQTLFTGRRAVCFLPENFARSNKETYKTDERSVAAWESSQWHGGSAPVASTQPEYKHPCDTSSYGFNKRKGSIPVLK
jgi:hypothetical protein